MISLGLRHVTLALAAAAALGAATSAAAQSYDGDWKGTLTAPNVKIGMMLHIKTEGGQTNAVMDIPDQQATLAAGAVKVADGKINILFLQAMAEVTGSLSPDGKTLNARWVQGFAIPVTFTKIEAPAPTKP
jgi:hypothetical protein